MHKRGFAADAFVTANDITSEMQYRTLAALALKSCYAPRHGVVVSNDISALSSNPGSAISQINIPTK